MRTRIESAEVIVLIARTGPDADSLGSACAMYAHLLRLHKRVTLYCAGAAPAPRFACLPWSDKITSHWPEEADLAIAFGCGGTGGLGTVPNCPLIVIDHQNTDDTFGEIRLVEKAAGSTSAVLMSWFKAEEIKINPKMATAMYAGIAEASRGFMGRRTDAAVFAAAAELARSGADIAAVNQALFLRRPLSALRLKGRLLTALRLECDARIAVLTADRRMLAETGADADACDAVLDDALGLPTVEAALLLCEGEDGSVRGMLRADDAVDVSAVAAAFGGRSSLAPVFCVADTTADRLAETMVKTIEKELK